MEETGRNKPSSERWALASERLAPANARAVLVAAGRSTRMRDADGRRKPLIEIGGRALLEITAAAFEASELVTSIVIVAHADDVDEITSLCRTRPAFRKVVAVVPGDAERPDSVRVGATASPWAADETNGKVEPPFSMLCIHDAARPYVSPREIDQVIAAACAPDADGAALLAIPVRDTLKHSTDGRTAERTVDRDKLWAAQTPQVFDAERFAGCLERAERDGFRPTDDAALWERYVGPVAIVPGSALNTKITEPDDLEIARALFARARADEGASE